MNEKKGFALNEFYSRIYKRYDLINRLFTFGLDRKWRKVTAIKCIDEKPGKILDLCCGTGDLIISISQQRKGNEHITGYDFNEKMLEIAQLKVKKGNLENITFSCGDAAVMPFSDNIFDAITIGFGFRNLTFNNPNSSKHIGEMHRVLKPGGKLFILESGVPQNRIVRLFFKMYLYLFLIPLGAIISGNGKAYWYLAHSSAKFYKVDEIRIFLKDSGFSTSLIKRFFFGASNLIVAQKE
jgi:demethylmenaquinone methyltransferase/2-methoxy-6-polyprenyl-1,4-benzoquinol methylase